MATTLPMNADGASSPAKDGIQARRKKRVRKFTSEERACHRVIEKQRREALNESFLDLARVIPALAPARRLSKGLIVQASAEHLREQRQMCLNAASAVQLLLLEHQQLLAEVNGWRAQFGTAQLPPKPVHQAISALFEVANHRFGTFPGGFGDNGQDGDPDGDAERQSSSEVQIPLVYGKESVDNWEHLIDSGSPLLSFETIQQPQSHDESTSVRPDSLTSIPSTLNPEVQNDGLMLFDAHLAATMANYEDLSFPEIAIDMDMSPVSQDLPLNNLNCFNQEGSD